MTWQAKSISLKCLIHFTALGFLVSQYYLAIVDKLGGDPVEAIIHFTGIGAFNLLLLTLLVSPLSKRYKLPWLLKSRRLLGLYTFAYALCHVVNFWAFEIQFDISLFLSELIKRPYITVGLAAFMILFALAITSFSRLQRAMGKNWLKLHSFIYIAVLCVAVHFYWSVKSEIIEPSIYILISLLLLLWRKQKIKAWFKSFK